VLRLAKLTGRSSQPYCSGEKLDGIMILLRCMK
jgi:hypothetical protein